MSDCRFWGREFDPTRSHTFMEIDNEIIFTAILLPSTGSRRVVVSYKRKYVHEFIHVIHVIVVALVRDQTS